MVKSQKTSEEFFVEVKNSAEVRRQVLESIRDILEMLQKFEKFKQIRQQKLAHVQKLRELMKNSHKMMGSLKTLLPQTNLKAMQFRTAVKEKPKQAKEEKPAVKKDMTEVERLESDLNAIEEKLKALSQ